MSRVALGFVIGLFAMAGVAPADMPASAPASAPTSQPAVDFLSPEVGGDGTVTFRFKAPQAKDVSVRSSVFPKVAMKRAANGLWTGTIKLEPEFYEYHVNVDGVSVLDPKNQLVKNQLDNEVLVPGNPPRLHEIQDVPHGDVITRVYQSKSLNMARRLHVYTPPGYDPAAPTRYPVLYLLHGYNDTDAGWTNFGRANIILDNLLAAGKIKPMIVVMPNGHTVMPLLVDLKNSKQYLQFEKDLLNDIIPMVESTYRVIADRDHRALGGLSMGAMHTLLIGSAHKDVFGTLCPLSFGGRFLPSYETMFDDLAAAPGQGAPKAQLKLLFLAGGIRDGMYASVHRTHAWLESKGIKHEFRTYQTGHDWIVWRKALGDLAPLLFRD